MISRGGGRAQGRQPAVGARVLDQADGVNGGVNVIEFISQAGGIQKGGKRAVFRRAVPNQKTVPKENVLSSDGQSGGKSEWIFPLDIQGVEDAVTPLRAFLLVERVKGGGFDEFPRLGGQADVERQVVGRHQSGPKPAAETKIILLMHVAKTDATRRARPGSARC